MDNGANILVIKSGRKVKRFFSHEVLYVSCEHPICDIHFVDGSVFTCTKTLVSLETELPATSFFRINHNVIINIEQIKEVVTTGRRLHCVAMKNGESIA